jgi:hypothetical protein
MAAQRKRGSATRATGTSIVECSGWFTIHRAFCMYAAHKGTSSGVVTEQGREECHMRSGMRRTRSASARSAAQRLVVIEEHHVLSSAVQQSFHGSRA